MYRLAQVGNIIDQCRSGHTLCPGVWRLASEPLFWRSSGFPYLLRSRANWATAVAWAYSGLSRQIGLGNVELFANHEMLELVVIDGHAGDHYPRRYYGLDSKIFRSRRGFGHGRLQQCLLPVDERDEFQCHRRLASPS